MVRPERTVTTKKSVEESLLITLAAGSTDLKDDEVHIKFVDLKRIQSTSFPKMYHDLFEKPEIVDIITMSEKCS